MKQHKKLEWSEPYLGITHFGQCSDRYRVTVETSGAKFILVKWYPGCGYASPGPEQEFFSTMEAAKTEGEKWVQLMTKRKNGNE